MSRAHKYPDSVLLTALLSNPGATLGQLSVVVTGRDSGSMRQRLSRLRADRAVQESGMAVGAVTDEERSYIWARFMMESPGCPPELVVERAGFEPTPERVAYAENLHIEAFGRPPRRRVKPAEQDQPEITVTAAGVDWQTDETARWEKTGERSSLFVRPREAAAGVDIVSAVESAVDRRVEGVRFPAVWIKPEKVPAQLSLATGDLHFGKRDLNGGWSVEIAQDTAQLATADLVDQAVEITTKFSSVLISGGDGPHTADGFRTTKGTMQHATSQTGAEVGALIDLTGYQLDLLAERGPVTFIGVSGNHGRDVETAALIGIQRMIQRGVFGRHVTCGDLAGNKPVASHYNQELKVLTHVRHGDDLNLSKIEQLALEMAMHPSWGEALFRDYHVFHMHHLYRKGIRHFSGMGFEVLGHPSLTGTDEWHARHMYAGAARMAVGALYRNGRRTIIESFRVGGVQ